MSRAKNFSIITKEHHFFKTKHLLQFIWSIEITLFLVILQRLYLEKYTTALIIFSVFLTLLGVAFLAKKNKVEQSAILLLVIMTGLISYFMWCYSGIYDEAVIAYPCVLIMTAMLGNKKLFISLFVFISLSILLNGAVNSYGIYTNEISQSQLSGAILIIFIFSLISYTIAIMAKDFRKILAQLDSENKTVKQSKSEIEILLRHDILTSLPNRLMANDYFQSSISQSSRDDNKIHIMFIDLDDFKLMNDALGHQAGDSLLIEIADRLKKTVRKEDLVCRFAGDEFIIILDSFAKPELVANIAKKIISAVQEPFYYQGHQFICGCSIGISVTPDDSLDFNTLVRNADTAMYHSKSVGGNSFHYFNDEMNTYGHEYLSLITDLRKAIKDEQFFLVYQPKIDLKENKIIGAEALIRWNHPEKGVIFPDFFIEKAEKAGLICDIGEWVLNEVCRVCKEWIDCGAKDFVIAVNISSKQFAKGNLAEVIKSVLEDNDLRGKHLELEMTESLLIDNSEELKNTFKYIRKLGVLFSVDDFGTGYSNLGYLKEFDISTLKIDRSFIYDIPNKTKNQALVKAIIQMAKGLELNTVAEGIEDLATANMLIDFECDSAQGYFWSKPIVKREFVKLVEEFNNESEKLAIS
ncbi:EAL domain-containing protein [Colwellia sp. E2M01]|uniref:putative bifunctional diguanylate cyclase/phosphodiesterase n=1 Tax=Colwellia sp. E2M01 TaxID=2841561 RepID=UPI001C09BEA3|nr:EAL domain-containing protein [Colwellia sp. E2M01]MBU2869814.1 EAL domain-containing protein [Colwellia sp. E2M01]